jgi:urease accessory protein
MENDAYLLLLLSDGNLPTGSFVSSSGLESYLKHGFPILSSSISPANPAPQKISATVEFIRESLAAYSRLALPFASDAHEILQASNEKSAATLIAQLKEFDSLFETMSLNHITRRASKAQGVALLTLFSKGFSRASWVEELQERDTKVTVKETDSSRPATNNKLEAFVDAYKLSIRKGETHGHLPVCWGVLTACLSLSKGK